MKETTLPEITKQEVKYIDATPDEDYPLRILRTYRDNCDCLWATGTDGSCDNPLFQHMNEDQHRRAVILDKAIKKLQE